MFVLVGRMASWISNYCFYGGGDDEKEEEVDATVVPTAAAAAVVVVVDAAVILVVDVVVCVIGVVLGGVNNHLCIRRIHRDIYRNCNLKYKTTRTP